MAEIYNVERCKLCGAGISTVRMVSHMGSLECLAVKNTFIKVPSAAEWRELAQDLFLDLLCITKYITPQSVWFYERPHVKEHIEKGRDMGLEVPNDRT